MEVDSERSSSVVSLPRLRKRKQELNASAPRGFVLTGSELKRYSAASPSIGSAINNTGFVSVMNSITNDATSFGMVGQSAVMKRLSFGVCGYSTVTTGIRQIHRYMVVYDTSTNEALPTPSVILAPGQLRGLLADQNQEYRFRFQVLYDSGPICVDSSTVAGSQYAFRHTLDLNHLMVKRASITYPVSGGLFMYFAGSQAAGVTAGTFNWWSDLYFEDV